MKFDSAAVHAGERIDPQTGALSTPLYQSNAFTPGGPEEMAAVAEAIQTGTRDQFLYTRWGNPTLHALEKKVTQLDGGESALAFASGMSAISTAIMAVVKAGDHIVASRQTYSGTHKILAKVLPSYGVDVTLVDPKNPAEFEAAVRPNTKLLYLETPSNPLLEVTDLRAIANIARRLRITSMADNTFATPYNQRPLDLGIDVTVYSTTKFLSGHGDALGGIVVGRTAFIDHSLCELHRDLGGVMSPFNAWLTIRGLQTLSLRMARHNSNALAIAEFLQEHPRVSQVFYPGLINHPGHRVASEQMSGFGGMLSFELAGGFAAGLRVIRDIKLCLPGATLGDVRTIVTHPASTTHYIMGKDARRAAGISEGLVRISVGIEDLDDLKEDLDRAIN